MFQFWQIILLYTNCNRNLLNIKDRREIFIKSLRKVQQKGLIIFSLLLTLLLDPEKVAFI